MRLTNEEFRSVFDYIKKVRKEGRIRADYGCEGFLGNYEGEVRNRLFSCQAGISVGSVMADGSIAACASIRADCQGNGMHLRDGEGKLLFCHLKRLKEAK